MEKFELDAIMCKVFSREGESIPEDAEINGISGWDSIAQINLMVELQAVGVPVEPMDIPNLTSYVKIKSFLMEKGFQL